MNIYDDTQYSPPLRERATHLQGLGSIEGTDMADLYREDKPVPKEVLVHIDPLAIREKGKEAIYSNWDLHMLDLENGLFNLFDSNEPGARDRMEMALRVYKEVNQVSKVGIYVPATPEKMLEKGQWSWWEYLQWQRRQRQWTQHADVLFPSVYRDEGRSVDQILQWIKWQKLSAKWVHGKPIIHYTWHKYRDTLEAMPMTQYKRIVQACGDSVMWERAAYRDQEPDPVWLRALVEML